MSTPTGSDPLHPHKQKLEDSKSSAEKSCDGLLLFCSMSGCKKQFDTRSKLNKHQNLIHSKPYHCLAENCEQKFGQKQQLERHTRARHADTSTKYYHCATDGCKYASSGQFRKKFTREDHVKTHIRDYGHYGPHSPMNLKKAARTAPRLEGGKIIAVWFEEWNTTNSIAQPSKIIKLNLDSKKTKLFHPDQTSDLLHRVIQGFHCEQQGCYYYFKPPESVPCLSFRSKRDLREHEKRAGHRITPKPPADGSDFRFTASKENSEAPNNSLSLFSAQELPFPDFSGVGIFPLLQIDSVQDFLDCHFDFDGEKEQCTTQMVRHPKNNSTSRQQIPAPSNTLSESSTTTQTNEDLLSLPLPEEQHSLSGPTPFSAPWRVSISNELAIPRSLLPQPTLDYESTQDICHNSNYLQPARERTCYSVDSPPSHSAGSDYMLSTTGESLGSPTSSPSSSRIQRPEMYPSIDLFYADVGHELGYEFYDKISTSG
ncbi:zinc finger protein 2 [Phlyctema vagabunda]|uniref:Zinc finger protein 2 n=1 Tax=Phlyctema vagabunda TaxID=108571 RepID=A0ABR4PM90_9HELO